MINSGAATTTTNAVTLTLSASDAGGTVTGMKISNDGVSYSSEVAYATSRTWTLSSGYGNKTVYVLFKDSAGNWMKIPGHGHDPGHRHHPTDRERGDQLRCSHNHDQCSDAHAERQRCRRNSDRDEDQQ